VKLNESLYSQYLKEKDGINTLETDKGLVTFIQQGERGQEFYIVDIFVLPEFRRTGYATELGEIMQKQAVELGAEYLLGAVEINSNTYDQSRKTLESFGFEMFVYVDEDKINYFKKDLNVNV
jgi:GNAT superfamily N-acetyltransferase